MARTESEIRAGIPPAAPAEGSAGREPVRARALVVGTLAAAATAALVTQAEMVLGTVRIGYLQFPPAALGMLLLVTALGRGAGRLARRWGLSASDLLVIYCMCLVAALAASHGLAEKLVPSLVYPSYAANSANGWHQLYDPHLPHRLVPYDPGGGSAQPVAEGYYKKLLPGESLPWRLWVMPILNWGLLSLCVLAAFLCLTAILRRQWVDNEKLAFPLAQLPLEIAGDQDRPAFFANRLMWLGVLLPVAVYTVRGLHQVYPSIPDLTLQWNLSDYVTTPPWNSVAWSVMFIFSFAAIGFFFLLPS